jgi:hypothetical protein
MALFLTLMLTNDRYGLCNGSREVVRGFAQEDDWEFEGNRRDFKDVCPSESEHPGPGYFSTAINRHAFVQLARG